MLITSIVSNKDSKRNILGTILIFFTILLAGSLFQAFFPTQLLLVYYLLMSISFFTIKIPRKELSLIVLCFFLLSSFIGLSYFVSLYSFSIAPYINLIARITFALLLLLYYRAIRGDFIADLFLCLKIIAFISLLNFIVSIIVPDLFSIVYINEYWVHSIGFIFYINSNFSLFGIDFFRNQGFFREPGILQIYLNILLFISLFIRRNRQVIILSSFLILSTFSTTGIFLMILQILVSLKFSAKSILAGIIIIIPLGVIMKVNLEEKVSSKKEVGSFYLRMLDLKQSVNLILENPLYGIGLDNLAYIKAVKKQGNLIQKKNKHYEFLSKRGNTNSLITLLAMIGIPCFLLYLKCLYSQSLINKRKILFFVILIISAMTEPLILEMFFLVFFVSGFKEEVYIFLPKRKVLIA